MRALIAGLGLASMLATGTAAAQLAPFNEAGVTTPSGVFQSEVVVHRLGEFLFAAEIALSCLNRGLPKQKLNLLKFSSAKRHNRVQVRRKSCGARSLMPALFAAAFTMCQIALGVILRPPRGYPGNK